MAENETNNKMDISVLHGQQQKIKMDLLGMIHSGENPFDIIYHLAQYLENVSAEAGYAQHILENLRSIYGLALGDKKLLTDELHEVEAREQRIRDAYEHGDFSDEEKQRMNSAIVRHKKNEERLQELIHKAEIEGTSLYEEK